MQKVKAILFFLFIDLPFYVTGGLEMIILLNHKVVGHSYDTKKITNKRKCKPKPKKQTDKDIFLDFMARNT